MVNDYVNSAAGRSRAKEGERSGDRRAIVVVGISFGLLCVLQSLLNISLRLRSEGDQPFQDLLQENEDMKERIRLLLLRNQELQDRNRKLRLDVKTLLKEINTCLVACDCRVVLPSCPEGWTMYRTSCYQTSETTNTWDHAKRDCEEKGAHLVIFNDLEEEGVLHLFEPCIETWIGLRAENPTSSTSAWTWVDGTGPTYNNWNADVLVTGKRCVFVQNDPVWVNWIQEDCLSLHRWICEKELSVSDALSE